MKSIINKPLKCLRALILLFWGFTIRLVAVKVQPTCPIHTHTHVKLTLCNGCYLITKMGRGKKLGQPVMTAWRREWGCEETGNNMSFLWALIWLLYFKWVSSSQGWRLGVTLWVWPHRGGEEDGISWKTCWSWTPRFNSEALRREPAKET